MNKSFEGGNIRWTISRQIQFNDGIDKNDEKIRADHNDIPICKKLQGLNFGNEIKYEYNII
jgi:hypothetical protein